MITTVTMNAALDKAYFMEKAIENGTVMRVSRCHTTAGGKGLNVARAIAICGGQVQATGLVGGFNGQYLESLLDQDKIPHQFGHVAGETRSCINILDPGYGSTEYLEPGFTVSPEEEQEFMERFPDIIRDSDVVTISGRLPPDFWDGRWNSKKICCIIDHSSVIQQFFISSHFSPFLSAW